MSDRIELDLKRGKVVRMGRTTSHDFADIEQLDDGLWYYKPTTGGVLAGWMLREIANLLDRANREWNKELESAMSQQPKKP